MYTPPINRQDDPAEILRFLRSHSFATLVTVAPDGTPRATHIPFLIEETVEGATRLIGHLAKANAQCSDLSGGGAALAIFQGPHAYISPVLYEKPLNVPTWNYVAVHAYGTTAVLESDADKKGVVDAMVRFYDPAYAERHESLPDDFAAAKLRGIVAFAIDVERFEARYKLSQDKTPDEQENIASSLAEVADSAARETADFMRSL